MHDSQENDIDLIVMFAHGYECGERISMGFVTALLRRLSQLRSWHSQRGTAG